MARVDDACEAAWGDVFGDAVIASAILDRILYHAIMVSIRGDSYRLKERRYDLGSEKGFESALGSV